VPSRELSDSTHPNFRQAHLACDDRVILGVRQAGLLEGRSLEQKRGLVRDITQAVVKNAGTTAEQVTVSLVETPKTSKAKGGVLFSEMPGR
jgi:4-oxalocrotonate tautomerase